MNIKEHIEAGHYERDEKGRALVPAQGGGTVVICATDMPGSCPILGFRVNESGDRIGISGDCGFGYWADTKNLLPPPPRKMKVETLAIVSAASGSILQIRRPGNVPAGLGHGERLVTLTGEYDQEWP